MNRTTIKPQWQSLEELSGASALTGVQDLIRQDEFPKGHDVLEVKGGVDRRHFLGMMGASMALTGTLATGCIRKPNEKILAYVKRPEDLVPGEARHYASVLQVAGQVYGVLVKSNDGRPIKIEGNPDHPGSLGGTNHFGQAEVLSLYDPDRLTQVHLNGKPTNLEDGVSFLKSFGSGFKQSGGKGLAFLIEWNASPTFQSILARAQTEYPTAKFYLHDESRSVMEDRAMGLVGLPGVRTAYSLKGAKVILALDADPLGLEGETVRLSREFADGRRVKGGQTAMNRLYCVESNLTLTGGTADNRLLLTAEMVSEFATELAKELQRRGAQIGGPGSDLAGRLGQTRIASTHAKWIRGVAEDLVANAGQSVIIAGDKQPEWVHALVLSLNAALGNVGKTVSLYPDGSGVKAGTLEQLAVEIKSGLVSGLVVIGGNPVYSAPSDIGLAELFGRIESTVYLGYDKNETSEVSKVTVPLAHGLEGWGDYFTRDGVIAIRQPLIAPLFMAMTETHFLASILGLGESAYELVRQTFKEKNTQPDFESAWDKALFDGKAEHKQFEPVNIDLNFEQLGVVFSQQTPGELPSAQALDLVFVKDFSTFDGRYSNHAWLQEMPDPMTKITWDNALLLSPSTAHALGLKRGDMVELSANSTSIKVAVFVQPGVAPFTGALALGYGRRFVGRVGAGTGFDAAPLRDSKSPYLTKRVGIKAVGSSYLLATTQGHDSMEGRPLIRENTLEGYKAEPKFVEKYELMPIEKQKTFLWTEPNKTTGQQWGMTIDLNSCTACNTCVIACQSENNVAIVGKKEVDRNREMAWIRIDRYFSGDVENPEVLVQPVNCMHCETAPCESVCPVGATIHSPEGMNDMAYNRCIGTRYCANNCPYKVRKFNYFNFSKRQNEMNPLIAMQQNPNVTVRFRGVIEKCSYCVQRVNKARIEAKVNGNGVIPDGAVKTACQQACPTGAIEFGDINQQESRVTAMKSEPRNYAILGELNTRPRTTYLAKLRNPHASLV